MSSAPDSTARRSAQTAMFIILDTIVRLITPILSFTADEIWSVMPHRAGDDKRSPMLNDMPSVRADLQFERAETWDAPFEHRDDVLLKL